MVSVRQDNAIKPNDDRARNNRTMFQTCRQIFTVATITSLCLGAAIADAQILRTNINADAKTLNPIQNSELISGEILKHVYESLTTLDIDGNIVPGLATSWSTSDDGMSATFKLREGVRFHSGREFTAADVKWTFEQALTPAKKGGLMVDSLKSIQGADEMLEGKATSLAGFTLIDKRTFSISFDSPTVIFPLYELFIVDSNVEAEYGEDWSQKVSAGTGPFEFKKWQRGVSVELLAFDEYWKAAPGLDGVTFFVVPNIETALSMYEANELDLVSVPRAAARNVRRDPRFAGQLIEKSAAQVSYLALNQRMYAPFEDRRVREAIAISLDRAAMVHGLFGGAAVPLYSQITPGFPGYDPSIPIIEYDPARAKALMAEAGHAGGAGLPPLFIQGTHQDKILLAFYADHLKKTLGFPITTRIVERGTHIRELNSGTVAMFPWGWTADYADPSTFLRDLYHSKSKWNRSRYVNPEFDALIDRAVTTANDTDRLAIYRQADRLLMADFGVVPTTVRVQIAIRRPEVDNIKLTAMGFMPFYDVTIQ
jgi:peptide/nickel transport system substrate-binding protein